MIDVKRARELTQEAKEARMVEFIDKIEREKISDIIEDKAKRGLSNFSLLVEDKYVTVAIEYFNSLGFAVRQGHGMTYDRKYDIEISW